MKSTTIRVFFAAWSLAGWGAGGLLWAQTPAVPQSANPASQATGAVPPAAPSRVARPGTGGSVRGTVKDASGGVIPNAAVTLANENGTVQTVNSGGDGSYTFRAVAPGTYTVSAAYKGLQQQGIAAVSVTAGQQATGNVLMSVQTQRQEVTVSESTSNTVSTDPANNASSLVLKQEDLDALPDDPDDLQADLQALAGPGAGPGGNQIYIDGFSGGQLPPKSSIREIRINSNPFSAEFDKLGYGRIQIFTKPGTDKFHGQSYYNISDDIWDSRNPFLLVNPPFRTQLFGGNVSGPIGKKASFFIDVERRNIDDNGIVTASVPLPGFGGSHSLQTYYPTPQRRTSVSPRVDYQINANNTLSFRYEWQQNDRLVTGVSGFNTPGFSVDNINYANTGYSQSVQENSAQLVETSVLSPKAVNETHFMWEQNNSSETSLSGAPQLNVSQSFVAGGSGYSAPGYPRNYSLQNFFELQNYTSITWGTHTTKFGARGRTSFLNDVATKNFNGVYSFLGSATPGGITAFDQYRQTILALQQNPTAALPVGLGPSKYTVTAGNPYISLHQWDAGPFIQDDWRVRPNLTFSFGVRYEAQTNINDHNDWAPRFAFAWSPDAKKGGGRAKTVIRGGWGMFYDRFGVNSVETARRYQNGTFATYTLDNPPLFLNGSQLYNAQFNTQIPLSALTAGNSAQRYQIDSHLRTPYLMQTAITLERQLLAHTTLNVNFMNSRGVHEFLTDDINAPIPTLGQLPPRLLGNSNNVGIRPFGAIGDIYDYQSVGLFKQTMVIVGVNSQIGKWLTVFSRYSYGDAHSNTDGLGTMPANPYNIAAEYGRSSLDIQHNLFLGGSVAAPWGVRLSPFLVAHSGTPFNVISGADLFLTGSNTPTARPAVVSNSSLYYGVPSLRSDYTDPIVSYSGTGGMIERNAGDGPGYIGLNLRVSKTWGFGSTKFSGPSGGASAGHGGGGGHGEGPGGFGGGGGGPRGGGGGGGPRGGGGGESTEHRYNVTFSVNARNLLNHENLNTVNGSINSDRFFLQSTNITAASVLKLRRAINAASTCNCASLSRKRRVARVNVTIQQMLRKLALLVAISFPSLAQKRPLTHDDYDSWRHIQNQQLSNDGHFLAYALFPQRGDGELIVRDLQTGKELRQSIGELPPPPPADFTNPQLEEPPILPPGIAIKFSSDSHTVVVSTFPRHDDVEKAKREKRKPEDMPKGDLLVVYLPSGAAFRAPQVKSFQLPTNKSGYVAYLQIPEKAGSKEAAPAPTGSPDLTKQPGIQPRIQSGDLVLRNLSVRTERRVANVTEYLLTNDGETLVYAVGVTPPKDGEGDTAEKNGVYRIKTGETASALGLLVGKGRYEKLAFSDDQHLLAFVSDRDDAASRPARFKLYSWDGRSNAASEDASSQSAGFRPGWNISDRANLTFSKDDKRIFFGTSPQAPVGKRADDATPADERVSVDLWSWNDDYIQPMQKVRAAVERSRSYRAVYDLASKTFTQLGDAAMMEIAPSEEGTFAIGGDDREYRRLQEYDDRYEDAYVVNTGTGGKKLVLTKHRGRLAWSPDSKFAIYYNGKDWITVAVPSGQIINLTGKLGVSFGREDYDSPSLPNAYGLAGWTGDGRYVLIYDRFDIWRCTPDGSGAINLTGGLGRKNHDILRLVRFERGNPSDKWIDGAKPLLLRAENEDTRNTGFYRTEMDAKSVPMKLVSQAKNFAPPIKARDAEVYALAASTFSEYPNLLVTDGSFKEFHKVSDANPQLAHILWGTSEMLHYKSTDGVALQGILYKPENFDPNKKYPLLVYIYERLSQGLFNFVEPRPSHTINPSYYASNGYLVLEPDIAYKVGYPGQSALNCVLAAVQEVVDRGYVNEKAIGIQGHSWGGYQIAYMVTQTNRFRAAAAGAPVADMISAYDGIRWGPGIPRQFQYERTQSRIGGTLWEYPLRYIENSPIFAADRVNTPLLMIHNDADDAVPWYQGVEYYLALRRLNKEVYLFTYNGEPHGLRRRPNQKDYTVRLQQFFDYYLKGAPEPDWMQHGIPYLQKPGAVPTDDEP